MISVALGSNETIFMETCLALLRGSFSGRLRGREIRGLKVEQVRDLARQVVLVIRDLTIGEHQAPHHFGQHHLLAEVVAALVRTDVNRKWSTAPLRSPSASSRSL